MPGLAAEAPGYAVVSWVRASVRARSRDLRAGPRQPQAQRAEQNAPRSTVVAECGGVAGSGAVSGGWSHTPSTVLAAGACGPGAAPGQRVGPVRDMGRPGRAA
ncbi:hypothetical protein GCM10023082_28330 [Streptomyces tremellae]|uniref:Uncharacterized protein n=1 Tax=Streptomyces tremellae TaxID=1124239 RepID=A0ABP7F3J2_9ACTN